MELHFEKTTQTIRKTFTCLSKGLESCTISSKVACTGYQGFWRPQHTTDLILSVTQGSLPQSPCIKAHTFSPTRSLSESHDPSASKENVQSTHSFSIQKCPTFNFPVFNLELLVIHMPSSTKLNACYLSQWYAKWSKAQFCNSVWQREITLPCPAGAASKSTGKPHF